MTDFSNSTVILELIVCVFNNNETKEKLNFTRVQVLLSIKTTVPISRTITPFADLY
jgi:hypothetical protein